MWKYLLLGVVLSAGAYAFSKQRPQQTCSPEDVVALNKLVAESPVLVLSKSYCPYCARTKKLLLQDLNVQNAVVVELDTRADGPSLQAAALELTGQKTVPNVFIEGKHIGGNDKVQDLHRQGALVSLLQNAGVM